MFFILFKGSRVHSIFIDLNSSDSRVTFPDSFEQVVLLEENSNSTFVLFLFFPEEKTTMTKFNSKLLFLNKQLHVDLFVFHFILSDEGRKLILFWYLKTNFFIIFSRTLIHFTLSKSTFLRTYTFCYLYEESLHLQR